MSISIGGFGGPIIAEIKNVSVNGVSGCGVYVLYLRLTALVANLNSEAFISQLSCRLETNEPCLKISGGVIDGHPVIRWAEHTDDSQLGFFFYLSSSQISSVEKFRNSGDLKLSIWLSGVVDYECKQNDFYDKSDYVISKQEWLEVLAAMQYKDTLLFELPMPVATDSDDENIKILLERAQSHILNGHYQETIGLCRQAIELVEKERGDKREASSATTKYKDNRKEMNVVERMLFLREGLKNITQLGAHHGDEFSRKQAQSVLGMTVALLSASEVGVEN